MNASLQDPWQALAAGAGTLGVPLTEAQVRQFQRYTELLLAANQQFNLTAIRDVPGIVTKLYLDGLSLLSPIARASGQSTEAFRSSSWRIADVGSGAGMPGIPLAVACPGAHLLFIESIAKKGEFLRQATADLSLDAAVAIARAESLGQSPPHREAYDLVVARAVAEADTLVELTLPLARVGGIVALPKGPKAEMEMEAALPAIQRLGGEVIDLVVLQVPGLVETRTLILLHKRQPTPRSYPRAPGIPAKRPIR